MTEPVLRIDQAHKSYGSRCALSGVSFELFQGEVVALLGPNGAGKTTLIRAICGRHQLDSGRLLLSGQELSRRSDRSPLGFVPQELAIYPDLTAEQNLTVFGRLHGVKGKSLKKRVESALEWTQLESRRNSLAGRFSGGMQRRLNIACGVLHQPEVLLLDEPTVGVDPQSRERIFEMLAELKRSGTAVLLTTHQLDEAEHRSDRIVIIDNGAVVASGTLAELIERTMGSAHRLSVRLTEVGDPDDASPRATVAESDGVEIHDLTNDLPQFVSDCRQSGIQIDRLSLKTPTLQDVFLHLTGRELRE